MGLWSLIIIDTSDESLGYYRGVPAGQIELLVMKLQAEINDSKYQIEFRREDDKVFAEIDGRKYEVEASEPEPNVFLLKHGGKIYQAFVSPQKNPAASLNVTVGNTEFEINLSDPKRLRGSGKSGEDAGGLAEIKTAMPGKVVRILVGEGDEVKKGDGIIVVEAMKMQNELKAPKDGVVISIKVAENDLVSAGDSLIVIE